MSEPILLEVVTPERRVFSAHVSELQFPTATRGYYGILPGHTPLIAPLGRGLLYYIHGGEKHWLTVFDGFAEVGPDQVVILAKQAETPDLIDAAQVHKDHAAALEALKAAITPEAQETAQTALTFAEIRLEALQEPASH
ncbi:MAG TPA: ATP synthase F1 subunit epsilon [Holophaga sp.]|jgi:F-type H+-transporting ATPase subunit epsilon|nr:ATP synthase F1 subunit epsilon [Holophaga sp.]